MDQLCKTLRNLHIREKILKAFCKIDRKFFVPDGYKELAYKDEVIPIKEGVTISQPSLLAYMFDLLDPDPNDKILEVGTGSGYSTSILSLLVGKNGKIISMEIDEFAYDYAKNKISKLIESGIIYDNIELILGDGTLGYPKYQPYDRIIVHTALPKIPNTLIWQLKDNGIIVTPIGMHFDQTLVVAKKIDGKIIKDEKIPVLFVPAKGKFGFYSNK